MASLTNDTTSTASVTNDALGGSLTWAQANFTWAQAQGTWASMYKFVNDTISTASLTNDTGAS